MPAPIEPPEPLWAPRLAALLGQLETGLLERAEAARLCLLAALAGEHVLLIGPPGTAKSELARRLRGAFREARYFERLLTRFSTPEELFGPLSLKALEQDRYERLVDGYLPTAGIAFLDEVFKANSAILNALLTLLNEREFDNGAMRAPVPLVCVVGASNEVPADESLLAFYDRFLLRVPVAPVSEAAFAALLQMGRPLRQAGDAGLESGLAIDASERQALLTAREQLPLAPQALLQLQALRARCLDEGLAVSDRRWRQLVGLLRSAASTEGRDCVDELDLWLAPYVVAHAPAQLPGLQAWFRREVAQAVAPELTWLTRAVEAFEQQLGIEASAQREPGDAAAGKMALARAIGGSGAEDEQGIARITRQTLEDQLRQRYSTVHIAARLEQLDEVLARARSGLAQQQDHAQTLARRLQGRLWLPPALARELQAGAELGVERLFALVQRLEVAREGFAALPVDTAAAPAPAPRPLAIDA